jgi:hypothetical protein
MTEAEWLNCNDALAMIEELRRVQADDVARLEWQLHRYYLACGRAIWPLLPQEASRRGIIYGERYLTGAVSAEKLSEVEYFVEAAAFKIDYHCADAWAMQRWIADVEAIPRAQLRAMLHPPTVAGRINPRALLLRAAYFADHAMIYPLISPKGPPPEEYAIFLSPDLLRTMVDNPFHPSTPHRP